MSGRDIFLNVFVKPLLKQITAYVMRMAYIEGYTS